MLGTLEDFTEAWQTVQKPMIAVPAHQLVKDVLITTADQPLIHTLLTQTAPYSSLIMDAHYNGNMVPDQAELEVTDSNRSTVDGCTITKPMEQWVTASRLIRLTERRLPFGIRSVSKLMRDVLELFPNGYPRSREDGGRRSYPSRQKERPSVAAFVEAQVAIIKKKRKTKSSVSARILIPSPDPLALTDDNGQDSQSTNSNRQRCRKGIKYTDPEVRTPKR